MANLLQTRCIQCPYCGETLEVLIDCSLEQQEYIEDCQVCCRPMVLSVWVDDDAFDESSLSISVRTEDE